MDNAGETRSDARVVSEGPALRENQDPEDAPTVLHRDREVSPTPEGIKTGRARLPECEKIITYLGINVKNSKKIKTFLAIFLFLWYPICINRQSRG